MRPRGTPPTPSARSTPIDPVGITATGCACCSSPIRITEPLPNCFSIADLIAAATAFNFSDSLLITMLLLEVLPLVLASPLLARERGAPARLWARRGATPGGPPGIERPVERADLDGLADVALLTTRLSPGADSAMVRATLKMRSWARADSAEVLDRVARPSRGLCRCCASHASRSRRPCSCALQQGVGCLLGWRAQAGEARPPESSAPRGLASPHPTRSKISAVERADQIFRGAACRRVDVHVEAIEDRPRDARAISRPDRSTGVQRAARPGSGSVLARPQGQGFIAATTMQRGRAGQAIALRGPLGRW